MIDILKYANRKEVLQMCTNLGYFKASLIGIQDTKNSILHQNILNLLKLLNFHAHMI